MAEQRIFDFYVELGGRATGGDIPEDQFEIRDNMLIIKDENGVMVAAYGCHTVSYIELKR